MKRLVWVVTLILLLALGVMNVWMINYIAELKQEYAKYRGVLVFKNANSRDTIFSMHNISKAHEITRGKGIKVGIIDRYFGYEKHPDLYAGGSNFSEDDRSFLSLDEHGYWMALTLSEVAPEAEIYALNIDFADETKKVDSMIKAINWAIENDLDVLTYSSSSFSEENEQRLNETVEKAIDNDIVTTFIHYYYEKNLLPDGLFTYKGSMDYNRREPDLNIFHYDYSVLMLPQYYEYLSNNQIDAERLTFLSISSTSPVTAGFVALLKSINNDLKVSDNKEILRDTSKEMYYEGQYCPRVVDIYEALQYLARLSSESN